MVPKIRTANYVEMLAFVEQDEIPYASLKKNYDSLLFLEEYRLSVSNELQEAGYDLECSFPVLGKSSMAFFIRCNSMSESDQVIRIVNACHAKCLREKRRKIGLFRSYFFPTVPLETQASCPLEKSPVPVLVFIRTNRTMRGIMSQLHSEKDLKQKIVKVLAGLGNHELIFYIRGKNITDIRISTWKLRELVGSFWNTYTLCGVPSDDKLKKLEIEISDSNPFVVFSTMARNWGRIRTETFSQIERVAEETYPHMCIRYAGEYSVPFVTCRQGYMDFSFTFKSKSISEAFDFVQAIRRIDGIIATATTLSLSSSTEER